MPQTPKDKSECSNDETWADDQRKRSYYYDDAYGYEKYDGSEEESEEDEADADEK